MQADFQDVEHTADWALRVRGGALAELLVNAATGMYAAIAGAVEIQPQVERAVQVTGLDAEMLLVNWLNELLYYTEVEGLVFGRFEIVECAPQYVSGVARGQAGLPLRRYVKAATFHNLRIEAVGGGLEAVIVFDM